MLELGSSSAAVLANCLNEAQFLGAGCSSWVVFLRILWGLVFCSVFGLCLRGLCAQVSTVSLV